MATYATLGEAEEAVESAVRDYQPRAVGDDWTLACPVDGHAESGSNQGSIKVGVWERKAGDFVITAKCFAGCSSEDVKRALGLWEERSDVSSKNLDKYKWEWETETGEEFKTFRIGNGPDKKHWTTKGFKKKLHIVKPRAFGHVADDDVLVIVEGERCAERVSRLDGFVGVTWPCGCGEDARGPLRVSMDGWRELIDRPPVYWPDNDSGGISAMHNLARALDGHGGAARVVDVSDMPAKGDIRDVDDDTALRMLAAAEPYTPPAPDDDAKSKPAAKHDNAGLPYEVRYNAEDDWPEVRFDGDEWRDIRKPDWLHIANLHEDAGQPFKTETELHWKVAKWSRRALVRPERERLTALADSLDEVKSREGVFVEVKDALNHLFVIDYEVMPRALVEYASRLLIGGSIQRRINPGCKLDNMPILVGKQGIGKSQAVRMLARGRVYEYTDAMRDLTAKRLIENTKGIAVVEMAEFKPSASELNRGKGVISQQVDTDREAYGRAVSRKPRGFAFVGTTNEEGVIPPDDSNRRFVIVKLLEARLSESDTYYFIQDHLDAWEAECARFVLDGGTYAMTAKVSAVNASVANTHFVNVSDYWVKAVAHAPECQKATSQGVMMEFLDIWHEALRYHGIFASEDVARRDYNKDKKPLSEALAYLGWTKSGRRRNGAGQRVQYYTPPEVAAS